MSALKLGTRGSQLALWQARSAAAAIEAATGTTCELVVIKTTGDRLSEATLSQVGGKRVFVKEIEEALVSGEIDLAVHSAKDMPADLPPELELAAFLRREEPLDAVVLRAGAGPCSSDPCRLTSAVGQSPSVGTGSVRRVAQLKRLWPKARFEPIRGNLDTRLRKLDEGGYDLIVLAVAGLRRLGFADRISATLPVAACVPAPGQGAIAIEIRRDDVRVQAHVAAVDDRTTRAAVAAERALVAALGGGCQVPIGGLATLEGPMLRLHAIVTSLDGAQALRAEGHGAPEDPESLGRSVAAKLVAQGADAVLEDVRRAQAPVEGLQP